LWGQLAKEATRPTDDEPEPPRRKEKEKTDSGLFMLSAAALIRRIARRTANVVKLAPRAFANAAAAATVRVTDILPDECAEAVPCTTLDAANQYWDFSVDSDAGAGFSAGPPGGPSLDL
jgi:hypothetical protein